MIKLTYTPDRPENRRTFLIPKNRLQVWKTTGNVQAFIGKEWVSVDQSIEEIEYLCNRNKESEDE